MKARWAMSLGVVMLLGFGNGVGAEESARRGLLGFDWHAQMQAGTPGFRVTKIAAGSPAQKEGLQVDDFITAVDGKPYTFPVGWESKIIRPLSSSPQVGQKVTLTIRRGSETKEVALVAAEDSRAADIAKNEQEAETLYASSKGTIVVLTDLIEQGQRITLRRRADRTFQLIASPLAPADVSEAEKAINGRLAALFEGLEPGKDHVIEFDDKLTPLPYRRISASPGG